MAKQMKRSGQNVYFCSVAEDVEEILQVLNLAVSQNICRNK